MKLVMSLPKVLKNKSIEELRKMPRNIHKGFGFNYKSNATSWYDHENDWVEECYLQIPNTNEHMNWIYFAPNDWIQAELLEIKDGKLYIEMSSMAIYMYVHSFIKNLKYLIPEAFTANFNSCHLAKELGELINQIPSERNLSYWVKLGIKGE